MNSLENIRGNYLSNDDIYDHMNLQLTIVLIENYTHNDLSNRFFLSEYIKVSFLVKDCAWIIIGWISLNPKSFSSSTIFLMHPAAGFIQLGQYVSRPLYLLYILYFLYPIVSLESLVPPVSPESSVSPVCPVSPVFTFSL